MKSNPWFWLVVAFFIWLYMAWQYRPALAALFTPKTTNSTRDEKFDNFLAEGIKSAKKCIIPGILFSIAFALTIFSWIP